MECYISYVKTRESAEFWIKMYWLLLILNLIVDDLFLESLFCVPNIIE